MTDTKGKTDNKDNSAQTSQIAANIAEAAARANTVKPVEADNKDKRAKYGIKPIAGMRCPIGQNMPEGAFVAARTHVGNKVDPAVRVFFPAKGMPTPKAGELLESDHSGNKAKCGIWTVLDNTDDRYIVGQSVRVNAIRLNSDN